MNTIVVDLDGTLTIDDNRPYDDKLPNVQLIAKLREYREAGYQIVVFTARNMRTYEGNVGKINIHTLPIIMAWLDKYDVPYDEVIVGKPWCGLDGFYVDDKSIRPEEFVSLSTEEIRSLISPSEDDSCL